MKKLLAWNGKWTIRKKLFLFGMLLLIVPIATISCTSYFTAKQETDALIKKTLENSVKLMLQNMAALNEMVKKQQLTLPQAQEKIKSMMLGEKQPDGTRPLNPEIDLGEHGYFYAISDTGTLLAHPNMEGTNVWDKKTPDGYYYIQDVIKKGQNGGGFTFYNWPLPGSEEEALKITYSLLFEEWNWIVAAGSYYQDYNEGQIRILHSTLLSLVICILLGAIGSYFFANHIAKPIIKIAEETKKVAAGDLTSDCFVIKNRDEIGVLGQNFLAMRDSLQTLVKEMIQNAEKVSSASQTLQDSIEETTQASRQIAESTQQIASGIETQAMSTELSAKSMQEMAIGIQRVAETSSRAYDTSVRSKAEAEQGQQLISQFIANMQSVQQAVTQVSEVMNTLNLRSNEIHNIVAVMTEIASQTSLLSLNASIEAARAGEHGRGFAVVAAEVKKLAEMSKKSSEQINALVSQVQSDITAAFQSTAAGMNEFQTGMALVEQTRAAFQKIAEAVNETVEQMQNASAAAEEMSASSEQIYASILELNRISNESAKNSEAISQATEEQIAVMDEIARSSQLLHQMAEDLKSKANQFHIKA